jgi:hypothetical protein
VRAAILSVVLAIGAAVTAAGAAPPPRETVQSIMDSRIDPAADALWEVAGTVESKRGRQARRPRTAEDWARARGLAEKVAAGAHLLQSPRPVGGDGHWVLADASTPGIRSADQISRDIARDPARFYAAAARLEHTAHDAARATDRRDIGAFLDAGARLDAACEACHAAYWYPRNPPQALPPPDVFARSAARY